MKDILIVEIGGTKTSLCVVEVSGGKGTIGPLIHEFNTEHNPEHEIQQIKNTFSKFEKSPTVASLSVPGLWDSDGSLKESYFLSDWIDFPLVKTLKKELGLQECIYETDVICGGLGEYEQHAFERMLYVNLGTGVGASLIENGKPYKAGGNLLLRMQKLVLPFEEEMFSGVDLIAGGTMAQGTKFVSATELFEYYKQADIEAIDLISKAQTQLAAWLINLFYLFAPDAIILNGGLVYDFDVLASGAIELAEEELQGKVQILPSKLKDLAPIHGAYVNWLHTH